MDLPRLSQRMATPLSLLLLCSGVLTLPCSRSLGQREPPSHQQRFQQLQHRDHQQQRRDAPHQDRARAGVPLRPQQLHVPGALLGGEQDCPWGSRFQSTRWPTLGSGARDQGTCPLPAALRAPLEARGCRHIPSSHNDLDTPVRDKCLAAPLSPQGGVI